MQYHTGTKFIWIPSCERKATRNMMVCDSQSMTCFSIPNIGRLKATETKRKKKRRKCAYERQEALMNSLFEF